MHPFVTIGNMEMPTYLACGVVGLTASMVMGIRLLAYRGMLRKSFSSMLISLPAILFGGRLFSALSLLVDRLVHKMPVDVIQLLSEGGIVYWGGLLAYTLMVLAICRLRNVSIRPVLDVLAVCTPLFHSIARIGCYCAGCCYGIKSEQFGLPYRIAPGEPMAARVPVQLLEAAFEFFLAIWLLARFNSRVQEGSKDADEPALICNYFFLYACFRFFIEFLRGDSIRGIYFGLSFSQYVSVLVLLALAAMRFYRKCRYPSIGSSALQCRSP